MTKIEMKSKGAVSHSSEKKHRRILSAAVLMLVCCLAFVGAVGAEVTQENAVAKVGTNYYDSLSTALSEAPDDSIVEVLRDCKFSGTGSGFTITQNNLTIVGTDNENPPTISTDNNYAVFIVKNNVTFKSLKFESTYNPSVGKKGNFGTCIRIAEDKITINIINCSLKMNVNKKNPSALEISGSSDGIIDSDIEKGGVTVNILGTTIDALPKGYGIKASVPVNLNVDESDVSGWVAFYLRDYSSGSNIIVEDSSVNGGSQNHGGTTGAISFGSSEGGIKFSLVNTDVEVTAKEGATLVSPIFSYMKMTSQKDEVIITGGKLTLDDTTGALFAYNSDVTSEAVDITISEVESNIDISDYLDTTDYTSVPKTDGSGYEIVPKELGLSITPDDVSFGTVTEGYTETTEKTVTLENTGNVDLTLKTLTEFGDFTVSGLESEQSLSAGSTLTIRIVPKMGLSVGDYTSEILIDTLNKKIDEEGNVTAKVTASLTVNPQTSDELTDDDTYSSSTGGGEGGHLSFPRTTTNGGVVDFGSSKVIKEVILPEGSSGSVILKVDTIEKWPKELETEYTFDISVEKLGEGMSYILFEIPLSTLESLELTPADICAYHFVDGEWVKLKTTYEVKDGTVYYEAETDSFSPFKLVIEKGSAIQKEEENIPTVPPTEEPEDKPQEELPSIPPVEPTEPESPSPILAVFAGLGAAVMFRRK